MAEQTANYQLVKPAPEEFYDRTIDNENLDKIDRATKEAKDAVGNIDLTEIEQSIEDLENQFTTNLTQLQQQVTTHLDESMPHKTADGTHFWNLKINTDGSLTFVFEEV